MKALNYKVFLVLSFLLISSFLVLTPVVNRINREVDKTSQVAARLLSGLIITAIESEDVNLLIRDVIKDLNFPVIITNEVGLPMAWEGIGIPVENYTLEMLFRPDLLKDDPGYRKVIYWLGKLQSQREPIEIKKGEKVVGYLYYGYPGFTTYIKLLPLILLAIGIITFLGLLSAARTIHSYEIENLWVNFAKGLAHQMGTPVSALFGWIQLMERGIIDEKVIKGAKKDLTRLKSILQRFSRVGGEPRLERVSLCELAREVVNELKDRFLKDINISVEGSTDCMVMGDPELLSWAIENLIKNSYEARKPGGRIWLKCIPRKETCELHISDDGHGIPRKFIKNIFKESFSTKERGWGIGLLVAKRIVEDIHKGEIFLKKSEPFIETTFVIRLKKA